MTDAAREARAETMVASKVLANLGLRRIQAKNRSTTSGAGLP